MYRNLVPKGVNIPNGFAITAYAYRYLSYEEALELQGQGFYVPDLNHVVVQDITINRVPKMEYNK